MKNRWKRTLSFALVLAMVLSMVPALGQTVFAQEAPAYETIQEVLDNSRFQQDVPQTEDEVVFLVELEEQPILDTVPQGQTLQQYMESQMGSVRLNTMQKQQDVMAAQIRSEELTIINTYTYTFNGFAVEGTYGDFETLKSMEGVKEVAVARRYDVPQPQTAEGSVITSGSMINSDAANTEGYTGKGAIVAILDTGLDITHPAFAGAVESPVFSKEAVSEKVAAGSLHTTATADDLYKSDKVPFAYDYADKDNDVSDANTHGTHVAGTIGANNAELRGVAPDAQLAIMKVFSNTEAGAADQDILAALEDCVILGVDAINMSLGTPCGFTSESEIVNNVYDRVKNAGINLMVAAGNDQSAAVRNLLGTDLALVGNPDYGIVGAPSTYDAALSVASVNEMLATQTVFKQGENRIAYFDTASEEAKMFYSLEGTYEYVPVNGIGNVNDFSKADVKGKIALVERGEIAFTEKETNAKNAGAIGLIVYDNVDGELFGMQLNGLLPTVSISKADGKLLKNAKDNHIQVSKSLCVPTESPKGGLMSDFSSIGVTPDLSLKPEITAPGGNVYSTLPGGKYGEMSGTSMACPHMAGAAAVMQQYADTAFANKNEAEKRALINSLLMSTAVPVKDRDGVAYTPRKQGAGLANVLNAIHSGAYLTVKGQERPKAELKDNVDGSFSFTFTVENFSNTEKTYNVGSLPLVAKVENVKGHDCISDLSRLLSAEEFTVTFSKETVTVPAGGSVSVDVTMALTQAGKDALKVFPNGIYLDGFITLTAPEGGVDLSLPYLGFYGDWGKAPVFDVTKYDNQGKDAFMAASTLAMISHDGQGSYLGVNAVTGNFDKDKIAYASRKAGYMLVTPMLGLLRAPKEITYTAYSNDDPSKLVYSYSKSNAMKSFFHAAGGFIYTDFVSWAKSWQPTDEAGEEFLPDGSYTYNVTARIDGTDSTQVLSFPIEIDNQLPQVVKTTYTEEEGVPYLTVDIQDNHYIMAAQLVNQKGDRALSPIVPVEETERGAVTSLRFDMSEIQEQGEKICRVVLFDYAFNQSTSDMISTNSQELEAQEVVINNYSITAHTDSRDMEVTAFVYPDNAVDKTLTWRSTDENVAKIVSTSEDTHTVVISFEGPGKCDLIATARNGVSDTADITVSAVYTEWPSDNVIREDGFYQIPANLNTTVTITDNAHKVSLMGDAGNTASAPYSNLTIDSKNDNLNLTIQDLHTTNGGWSGKPAIIFTGAGNTLKLVGENTLSANNYMSKSLVSVAPGVELTIDGSGTLQLNSQASCYGAGIGGNAGQGAGKITINGGTFDINAPGSGAAIGAGANSADAEIIINNGTFDIAMALSDSAPSNLSNSGAAIGSGDYATNGSTKITINGGSFTGFTQVNSPIIGLAHRASKPASLLVEINGGSFDLTSQNTDTKTMSGGACIGTGTPEGDSYPDADIYINGGEILAKSDSHAAAIGGGAGSPTGNIYVSGGTITAVSSLEGDAIGKGAVGKDGNIRIGGGSVKAVSTGKGAAFGDTSLVNMDSDPVYLVNLTCPNVKQVLVNGVDWKVPANHPDDEQLYLWLTASETPYEITVEGDTTKTYEVIVDSEGNTQISNFFNLTCELEHMTSDAPATVKEGEKLTVTLTAEEGYSLPETMEVTMGGEAVEAYANGVVTIEAVTGDVVIRGSAVQPCDKTQLKEAIAKAEALKKDEYTAETWAKVAEALEKAKTVDGKANATQTEVDEATTALVEAMKGLLPNCDKTQLKKDIATVELTMSRLSKKVLDETLWTNVEKALEKAKTVEADASANQETVDAADKELMDAFQLLMNDPVCDMYKDVPEGAWYYNEVDFVTRYGLMNGLNNNYFAPKHDLTRGQMVTILYRLEGSPEVSGDMPFTDVAPNRFYTKAILWAYETELAKGVGDGRFAPESKLTRQQLATFMMRYAEMCGADTSKRADLSGYTDAGKVMNFAREAMEWAVAEGLIKGVTTTTLAPASTANRAQGATILARLCKNILWK